MKCSTAWQIEAGGPVLSVRYRKRRGGDSSAARRLLHNGLLASREQNIADVGGQFERLVELEPRR